MKRKLTIIITLMAIALLSVEASAQKFVFNFTEYDFCISGSELGTSQHAKSVVTINKKTSKETGEDYSIVITSEALVPSIYDNVKLVDYIDADGLIEIVFAITGTHYLLVCLSPEEQFGAILELNPENTDDDVASYTNDIDDNAGQAAFLKEFNRLNDFVTANYEIDKNKAKNPDVIVTPVIPDSKKNGAKTETKPAATAAVGKTQKQSVSGLPSEIEAVPLAELKTKVLRESKGDVQTGLIYSDNYKGVNDPISVPDLIERPLGIPSIGWESLCGEKQVFETLVKQGIAFEGVYKHKFDKRYSPTTALLLKKALVLKPKVDFGTFSATWRSYSAIPQMHLNYDDKTGEAQGYPSFSYSFELADRPSGYSLDKKKGLKAIEKSFENFLAELRLVGFKVTKRKDYKGHYEFEKGAVSGEMYLRINNYMVENTEMVILIRRSSR